MNGWRFRIPPALALAAALGPGCDRSADLELRLESERRQHADALRVRDDQIAQFGDVIEKLTADIRSLRKEIDALRPERGGAAAAEKKPEAGTGPAPAPMPAAARTPAASADGPTIQNQRAAIALLLAENVELRSRLLAIARERAGAAPADPPPDPLTFPLSSVEDELARIHHALTVLQDRLQVLERR